MFTVGTCDAHLLVNSLIFPEVRTILAAIASLKPHTQVP